MENNFDTNYWDEITSKLKMEFPQLTNSDLLWRQGQGTTDDLIRMIASKLGKTRKEMQEIIAVL